MNRKLVVRIGIDVLMTGSLLLLMSYSLLGEIAHEWIGIVMFTLFVIHHLLNRKWLKVITKGTYSIYRILQTILVFIMLLLMIGSMISGIILSNHIFTFIKFVGISMEARQVHMLCAFWGFTVMSFHLGIHWNIVVSMIGKLFKKPSTTGKWISRGISVLVSCYGACAFIKRHIGDYLFLKMHFVYYDYSENIVFFILDYLAIMILIAFVGYYFFKDLKV